MLTFLTLSVTNCFQANLLNDPVMDARFIIYPLLQGLFGIVTSLLFIPALFIRSLRAGNGLPAAQKQRGLSAGALPSAGIGWKTAEKRSAPRLQSAL
ncbi:hypothetical protein AOLI_G00101640 [Acnodon oligacanthus]